MRLRLVLAALAFIAPAVASAAAPEPRSAVDLDRFMGRWFEILRTPNHAQSNCYAAYQVWSQPAPGNFSILQVCHRNSPSGPEWRVQTRARTLDAPTNAKFEASFFGGLFHRQYWVLDHAADYGWMIASTADGEYVAALARRPDLSPTEVSAMKQRVAELGLPTNRTPLVQAP